eukprot:4084615-Prymnesium_polylepis.1
MSSRLIDAETAVAEGEKLVEEATAALAAAQAQLAAARTELETARHDANSHVKPRSLSKAYALWALTPLIWPGGYLFYLGRDTEAMVQTVTFGGYFVGWLCDCLFIPTYVADANEPPHALERARERQRACFSLLTLVAPVRWFIQVVFGITAGLVGVYLLPRAWLVKRSGGMAEEVIAGLGEIEPAIEPEHRPVRGAAAARAVPNIA